MGQVFVKASGRAQAYTRRAPAHQRSSIARMHKAAKLANKIRGSLHSGLSRPFTSRDRSLRRRYDIIGRVYAQAEITLMSKHTRKFRSVYKR